MGSKPYKGGVGDNCFSFAFFLCWLLLGGKSRFGQIGSIIGPKDVGKRQSKGGEGGRNSGTVAVPEWELLHGDGDGEGLGVGGWDGLSLRDFFWGEIKG